MSIFQNFKVVNRFHALGDHFYQEFRPIGLTNPRLQAMNNDVAELLGIEVQANKIDEFIQIFSGNRILEGSKPLAHDYAGHQMGKFNPFLGDGRTITLMEVETRAGFMECNLKGVGKTPYSRDFDGLAGLSGCLREFGLSHKLTALNVPVVQSLCVISGDQMVHRGEFEPAAVLTRIAPSFIRFGTFENYYFQRNTQALKRLADFTIKNYFPEISSEGDVAYAQFFKEVVIKTAQLIAKWQHVGFVHGMMNTDNQSILGITLDLGESSFTDMFEPEFVSAKSDEKGRYAFGYQPQIGLWNCNVLAKALSPIIKEVDLRSALECYEKEYLQCLETLNSKNN